ncbi:30S ribosomal protein S3 [Patescibacteria group bacterium]|nr:30S ribosomal protein S3 [Patescibacteria group bacterium]MBU1500578.1 30S ribosomal protein S3 [Patescibacteria group bacterium]MBU2080453.1 30S ribosomal protein S3 [Patescibacteria group bacterium]MBU2123742.1 30S ribosomal protein S3 [Patescibacteria group bacterium]MBU2194598.1 30S ribosomal protein S3 [Patescibacteria group bacterium]
MTHTVHPYAHRLGIIRDWKSRWFATDKQSFRENIAVDAAIRGYFKKRGRGMYIADLEIERTAAEIRILLHTARPGVVIGRSGDNATKLRNELTRLVNSKATGTKRAVKLDIIEVRQPETSAAVVGLMVAEGLEKRMPFRRVLKQTVEKVMAVREVVGVRIVVSGRLGGADMSRTEQIKRGRIPLQTFRANIDYAHQEALLPYGVIGIKVWIYLGETFTDQAASGRIGAPKH